MRVRSATFILAIGLLGVGFAAFVFLAGGGGADRGREVSADSSGGHGADGAGVAGAVGRGASTGGVREPSGGGEGSVVGVVGVDAGEAAEGAEAAVSSMAADPAEAAGSEEFAGIMRKLARDLEFTRGLPEPPQQLVQPQPEPWRRDPAREGPPPEITGVSPQRGRSAGGERVEIRGRNLRAVSVMFGASPGRLLAATDSLVTVEAPVGTPGPATIALTNEDGTWGVAAEAYVYGE